MIFAEYKDGRKMQKFQSVTDADELEQILYFKTLVMKEAKYCFIKLNGNCFFLRFDFRLILFSVICSRVFSRIRSFAHENRPPYSVVISHNYVTKLINTAICKKNLDIQNYLQRPNYLIQKNAVSNMLIGLCLLVIYCLFEFLQLSLAKSWNRQN